jgi:hypothetical protein
MKEIIDYGLNSCIEGYSSKNNFSGSSPCDLRRTSPPPDTSSPPWAYPFFLFLLVRFGFVFETSSFLIGLSLISQRSGTDSTSFESASLKSPSGRKGSSLRSRWRRRLRKGKLRKGDYFRQHCPHCLQALSTIKCLCITVPAQGEKSS